jgi:hypothetical protein
MKTKNKNNKKRISFLCILFILNRQLCSQKCSTIIEFFFNTLKLNTIPKQPIFKLYGSSGITERSIVTTPIGLYYNFQQNTFSNISIDFLLLNSVNGVYFGSDNRVSSFIMPESYIKGITSNIYPFLQNTRYEIFDLPFFGQSLDFISIEAKRLTCMINGTYAFNDTCFSYIQVPCIYKVFHPSMPSEIQGAISMEVSQLSSVDNQLLNQHSIGSQESSRDIIIEHSVVDFFGVDNIVFGLGKKIFDEKIIFDGRILLPGKNIRDNIIGGNIKKGFNYKQRLSLKNILIELIENNSLLEAEQGKIKNMLFTMVDRIVLGSYYNSCDDMCPGLSPSIVAKIPIVKGFFLDFYGSYIYSFNQERAGIGIVKNDEYNEDDYKSREDLSEKEACRVLSKFSKILYNRFIPVPCYGVFIPGGQFQGSFAVRSTVSDMTVALGVDAWHKKASEFIPSTNALDIADLLSSTQCNLFFNFEYYGYFCSIPYSFQCMGQITVYSQNISKDFGGKISLAIEY